MDPDTWQGMSKYTVSDDPVGAVFGVKSRIKLALLPPAMALLAENVVMACGLCALPDQRVVVSNKIVLRCTPPLLFQVKSTRRMLMAVPWLLVRLI